ncbi:hypothetical protein [Aerosakkonema funiforme]|uniref:hypothetical protein n=1 Tax=Aerosakkonema funiforme TaxID=1246630 RepID=UPI0035B7376E
MLVQKIPAFTLSALIYVSSITLLSTVISGCTEIFPSKTLSQAKAERIINKWLESKGTISNFKGVTQNENESVAVATLEVANFQYKSYGNIQNYSGPAAASFTRYTDGTWAMTQFTITPPGNWIGTTWWDTNVKE